MWTRGGIAYYAPCVGCAHSQRLGHDISRQEHTVAAAAMSPAECMGSYTLTLEAPMSFSIYICLSRDRIDLSSTGQTVGCWQLA